MNFLELIIAGIMFVVLLSAGSFIIMPIVSLIVSIVFALMPIVMIAVFVLLVVGVIGAIFTK